MNVVFPSNTIHTSRTNYTDDFEIELQQPINGLNSDSYIEITNVSYPNTIKNAQDDKSYYYSLELEYSDLSRWEPTDFFSQYKGYRVSFSGVNNSFKFETEKIEIKSGIYSLKDLLQVINVKLEEYGIKLRQGTNNKVSITWNSFFEIWIKQKDSLNTITSAGCEDSHSFARPKSTSFKTGKAFDDKSVNVFHPYNYKQKGAYPKASKFDDGFFSTVKMKLQFSPSLNWVLGFNNASIDFTSKIEYEKIYNGQDFSNVHFIEADHLPDIKNGINSLYIYCDQLQDQIVGNENSDLLTIVPLKDTDNIGDQKYYRPPQSRKRLKKNVIDSLHFTVKDSAGNPIHFNYGNVIIEAIIHV